jgi:hypothetical protein
MQPNRLEGDTQPLPVILEYGSARTSTSERFPLHPHRILGIWLLCASVFGIVLLCICSGQISPTGDWSANALWLGTCGIFLVMMSIPGLGLMFTTPGDEAVKTSASQRRVV